MPPLHFQKGNRGKGEVQEKLPTKEGLRGKELQKKGASQVAVPRQCNQLKKKTGARKSQAFRGGVKKGWRHRHRGKTGKQNPRLAQSSKISLKDLGKEGKQEEKGGVSEVKNNEVTRQGN